MKIFKSLVILMSISFGCLYSSVEDAIGKNEIIIDALLKQLELTKSESEKSALQSHIDSMIEQQNKLFAQKAAGNSAVDSNPNTEIRNIVRDELAKCGITPKVTTDTAHTPTPAELAATQSAENSAPALPEQQTEAMAQYELALNLYNKGAYKESAASFGRIIKTYSKDPIAAKALVHLAYCLEKQGDIESASVVCESALQKKLDDVHQVDCQLIRLEFAKTKKNEAEVAQILKSLKGLPLTDEQQLTLNKTQGKKLDAPKPLPAKETAKTATTATVTAKTAAAS